MSMDFQPCHFPPSPCSEGHGPREALFLTSLWGRAVRGGLLFLCIYSLLVGGGRLASARQITDMRGRAVQVPDVIRTVYGTTPPATCMVYAMDPGRMAGLNFPVHPREARYLDPRLSDLPVIGGWFGQGRVANLETLLAVRPDIILVWMWHTSVINEKMEAALKPLGIPVVYLALDSLGDYPRAFRFLGDLLGLKERGAALAQYAEETLRGVDRLRASIPASRRISVYYAEGSDGLSTECHRSMHAELIERVGGENVHRCRDTNPYGMQRVSIEQLLGYDPQVIISQEPLFFKRVVSDPRWKTIRAVREGQVYRIPKLPFSWFDRPPSFMQLLGVRWLAHRLYPGLYPLDPVLDTQAFYRLFLHHALTAASAREVLKS